MTTFPISVVAADGSFRSKPLDTNDKFSQVFDKPGEYSLFLWASPVHEG